MFGVIVVYAGRSRPTCYGRDAYIHDHIYTGLTRYENTIQKVMQSVISYSHGDNGVYHSILTSFLSHITMPNPLLSLRGQKILALTSGNKNVLSPPIADCEGSIFKFEPQNSSPSSSTALLAASGDKNVILPHFSLSGGSFPIPWNLYTTHIEPEVFF